MSETDVRRRNLLVQAAREDDAALAQSREDVRRRHALGQLDGRHGVGLVLGLGGQLGQAKLGNGGLDAVGRSGVGGEALGEGTGGDLRERSVQGAHELGCGRGEVRGLAGLVVLHDGHPVGHRGVVAGRRGLAGAEAVHGTAGEHGDAEAGRAANGLLGGRHDSVNAPGVKGDLLAANGAHAVDDDEGVGADAADDFGHGLDVAEDTGRGVDMRDGDHLVVLFFQGLFDLCGRRPLANGRLELRGARAVGLETGREGVGKVAGVQDEGIVTALDQIRGDEVPSQRAGASQDKGLSGGVCGLEELAEEFEGFAKGVHKGGTDMALAGAVEALSELAIEGGVEG